MSIQLSQTSGSPFDRIKQTRPDGTEYWCARRLQILMGYARWENFQPAIARAMQTASNTGMDVAHEFLLVPPVLGSQERSTSGRFATGSREDYELSRTAAHLVSMNGDPNKPEVAAAQIYFSERTEQAETIQANLAGMPDWVRQQMATLMQIGKIEADQRRQEVEIVRQAKELLEHRARLDAIEGAHDWYSALAYAKLYSLPTERGFLAKVGTRAGQILRDSGSEPGKTQHPAYGTVNTYPDSVLACAFSEVQVAHAG